MVSYILLTLLQVAGIGCSAWGMKHVYMDSMTPVATIYNAAWFVLTIATSLMGILSSCMYIF